MLSIETTSPISAVLGPVSSDKPAAATEEDFSQVLETESDRLDPASGSDTADEAAPRSASPAETQSADSREVKPRERQEPPQQLTTGLESAEEHSQDGNAGEKDESVDAAALALTMAFLPLPLLSSWQNLPVDSGQPGSDGPVETVPDGATAIVVAELPAAAPPAAWTGVNIVELTESPGIVETSAGTTPQAGPSLQPGGAAEGVSRGRNDPRAEGAGSPAAGNSLQTPEKILSTISAPQPPGATESFSAIAMRTPEQTVSNEVDDPAEEPTILTAPKISSHAAGGDTPSSAAAAPRLVESDAGRKSSEQNSQGKPLLEDARQAFDAATGKPRDHVSQFSAKAPLFTVEATATPPQDAVSAAAGEFVDSLKTADAGPAEVSDHWTQVEKSSVIAQLVEKARLFQWDKNSEIVISLKPESLGRVSLRAAIVDRTLMATITAESERVRNLLESELPTLHQALQKDGMPAKVEVIHRNDLDLTSTGGGNSYLQQNPAFRRSHDNVASWLLQDNHDGSHTDNVSESTDSRYVSRSIHLIA